MAYNQDVLILASLAWFAASLYLLRYVAFAYANYRRRKEFEIPFPERYRSFPFATSPHRHDKSVEFRTEEVVAMGFQPVADLEDSANPASFSRLCIGETGTLCFILPAPEAKAHGDHHDQASYVLVDRFDNGKKLSTTNVPYYSRWMDSLPGRRTMLVDSSLPFLEGYGQHSVMIQKESANATALPYERDTLLDEIANESRNDYKTFVAQGYFRLDKERRCYRPSRRFLWAYTTGIASPGLSGKLLLGGAAIVCVTAPLMFIIL